MPKQHKWKTVQLGDVAEFMNGYAFKPSHWGTEGIPIIRIQNLTNRSNDYNRTNFIPNEKYIVTKGDLLVSWSATLGCYIWNSDELGLLNQHIFKVFPHAIVNKNYLKHVIEHQLSNMALQAHGATMLHITKPKFLATEIPLPPLEEQKRIAKILDSVSSQITQAEKILALCEALHAQHTRQFLEKNPIELEPLKDCIESIESGWSPVCESTPAMPEQWGVLKLSAVSTGRFIGKENKALPIPPKDASRKEVRPGDVLMTRKNTPELVGAVALVENIRPKLLFPDLVFRINLLPNKILPRFFQAVLMSSKYRHQVRSLAGGSAKSMSNISQAKLRELKIPVPSIATQETFSKISLQIDQLRNSVLKKLSLLEELQKSLQTRAFQGLL